MNCGDCKRVRMCALDRIAMLSIRNEEVQTKQSRYLTSIRIAHNTEVLRGTMRAHYDATQHIMI